MRKLFTEICNLLGTKKTRTTLHHPQFDALMDRFTRILETILSNFVNDNNSDWDEYLPYVMMAYRSTTLETSGFSTNTLI